MRTNSDYWTNVLIIFGNPDVNIKQLKPYLLASRSCTLPLIARGPDKLMNIVLRNIHMNLCLQVKLNQYATYYDFSRAESVINRIVLPKIFKHTLLYHARNCPIHGRTIFEKSNTYRNGRVYIIKNSELDQLLKKDKRVQNGYLDSYHTRKELYTTLNRLYPTQEYQRSKLIQIIIESVKFSNKFI
jgi:hypothetical protein